MRGTNFSRIKNKKIQTNNKSGVNGVSWHKLKQQWYARISFGGKTYSLGYFDDLEDAKKARENAEKQTFDDFIKKLQNKKVINVD